MCDTAFDALPWLSLKTDRSDAYLFKYFVDEYSVKVLLCDLCYVYEEVINIVEAQQRFVLMNADTEISKQVLIEELQRIFSNISNHSLLCTVSVQENIISVKVSVKLFDEIDVEWKSVLKRTSPEVFQKQFTIPLLALTHNLNSALIELKQIILKKDRQINDYKDQRVQLRVKHLNTADFNENEFNDKRISVDSLNVSMNCATVNETFVKLGEDDCFRKICEKINVKKEETFVNNELNPSLKPVDEKEEELRKRKELEDKIRNKVPSTISRKKNKLNL